MSIKVISGWLCRDEDGDLYFYDGGMPTCDEGYWYASGNGSEHYLRDDAFPEITAGMAPVEAKCIIEDYYKEI